MRMQYTNVTMFTGAIHAYIGFTFPSVSMPNCLSLYVYDRVAYLISERKTLSNAN